MVVSLQILTGWSFLFSKISRSSSAPYSSPVSCGRRGASSTKDFLLVLATAITLAPLTLLAEEACKEQLVYLTSSYRGNIIASEIYMVDPPAGMARRVYVDQELVVRLQPHYALPTVGGQRIFALQRDARRTR